MKKKIEYLTNGETMTQHEKEVSDLLALLNGRREKPYKVSICEFPGIGRLRVREVIDS